MKKAKRMKLKPGSLFPADEKIEFFIAPSYVPPPPANSNLARSGSKTASFARQQHWGQLVDLLPLDHEAGAVPRPLRANEGDSVRLTAEIVSEGGGGSIYFPDVTVVVPGSASGV